MPSDRCSLSSVWFYEGVLCVLAPLSQSAYESPLNTPCPFVDQAPFGGGSLRPTVRGCVN